MSLLSAYNSDYLNLNGDLGYMTAGTVSTANVTGAPFVTYRNNESSVYNKFKGMEWGVANEVTANLKYTINDSIADGELEVNIIDEFYGLDFKNKRTQWVANVNPIHDGGPVREVSTPSALHNFIYYESYGFWNLDFRYLNPNVKSKPYFANSLTGNELNYKLNDDVLNWFKTYAHYQGSIETNPFGLTGDMAISLGNWGTTYTYLIDINNLGNDNRKLKFFMELQNFLGVSYTIRDFSPGIEVTENNFSTGSFVKYITKTVPEQEEPATMTIFDETIPAQTRRVIRISTLNGVGAAGFRNWLELGR
jgi:hypothetical protein